MKSLRNLTLAATLALIGMAGGYAGDASAASDYLKPGESRGIIAIKPGELLPAVKPGELLPAVKPGGGDGAAEVVVGAGGRPGETHGLIGLLKPADQTGIADGTLPAVQMPTDQKGNGDGRADLVAGAGGGANGKPWTGPVTLDSTPPVGAASLNKVGTGTLTLGGNAGTYGSLHGLGSTRDLFANSRGGDQAAGAHGAGGGGGAGKVAYQDTHYGKPGDGSVVPTDQLTGKGETTPIALLLPAVQAAREAARRQSSSNSGGSPAAGGQIANGQIAGGGAAKGLNFTNTARK